MSSVRATAVESTIFRVSELSARISQRLSGPQGAGRERVDGPRQDPRVASQHRERGEAREGGSGVGYTGGAGLVSFCIHFSILISLDYDFPAPNGGVWGGYVIYMLMISFPNQNSILCGDLAIKLIEEPFISNTDDNAEWAI